MASGARFWSGRWRGSTALSWNSLLAGALDALKRHGAEDSDLTIVRVPGAFEMPLALEKHRRQR